MCKALLSILSLLLLLMAVPAFAQVAAADRDKLLAAAPERATVSPKRTRTLLIFQKTSGWTPPQRALVDTAMAVLGRKTGAWRVGLVTEDAAVMDPAALAGYDAILMNNCNELMLSESQSKALQDFVKSGKGVLGLGSTISIRNWPEEAEMWGGFCYRHPIKGVIPLRNEDPSHPLTRMFSPAGVNLDDTWYVVYSPTAWSRDKQRMLLSWNWPTGGAPATDDKSYPMTKTGDYPISYIRNYGRGRLYFNDFMHLRASPIFEKNVLQHLADVTQWALGDLELDEAQARPGPAFTPRPYTGPARVDASRVPALLTAIKGGDPQAIWDLAKAMPDPRAEGVFPDIVKLLATVSGSWYVSQDAAMGVGRMGEHGKPLAALIAARLTDPNPAVRVKLMYALEEMGPAAAGVVTALQAGLKDANWLVRQGAAAALGNIGAAAVPAYLEMLKSEAWFTRFQAIQGLGKSGDAARGSPQALAALQGALGDSDPEVVNAARRALAQLGAPVPVLRPWRSLRPGARALLLVGPAGPLPSAAAGIPPFLVRADGRAVYSSPSGADAPGAP